MPSPPKPTFANTAAGFAQMLTNPDAGKKQVSSNGERMDLKDARYNIWLNDKVAFGRQVLNRWEYKPFQVGMLRHKGIVNSKRIVSMALCPRDSGKSEVGTIDDYTHEICRNPNVTGLFISESQSTAMVFLGGVKSHFENNPGLIKFFGNHVPKNRTWNTKELISAQKTDNNIKESTLEAKGSSGSLIGRHHDFHFYDDLVSPKTAGNVEINKQFQTWFSNSAFPALRPGGTLKIRGTRYDRSDLYGYFYKRFGEDCLYHIRSLEKTGDNAWVSYFPERYPVDVLLELKAGDPLSFALQYQNEIDTQENNILKVGNIKFIDMPASLEGYLCFIGVDPATGKKAHNDYFATCTIAYNPQLNEIIIIRATKCKLGDPHSMLQHLMQEWSYVRDCNGFVQEMRLETNGFQRALLEAYYANPAEFGLLPIVGASTDIDKILAMQQKCHWINLGKTSMVEGQCDELLDQLIAFPGQHNGHEDLSDAFLRALEAMDESSYAGMALPTNIMDMTITQAAFVPGGFW